MRGFILNSVISVIVPVFNTAKEKLLRAKLSLDRQDETDFEVVWYDDGSKEETAATLDAFASERHRVYHRPNRGQSEARYQGFLLSRGDYVLFLDSDDYLEPDALSSLLSEAKRTGSRMVIGSYLSHREGKKKGRPWLFRGKKERMDEERFSTRFLHGIKIRGFVWGRLYARSLLEEVYPFPYPNRLFEDACFTLALGFFAKDVSYLPKPIYHYMVGSHDSLTGKANPHRLEDHLYAFMAIKEFLKSHGTEKSLRQFRRSAFWMKWNLLFDARISVRGGLPRREAKRIVKDGVRSLKE